jgi:hypothetical protein
VAHVVAESATPAAAVPPPAVAMAPLPAAIVYVTVPPTQMTSALAYAHAPTLWPSARSTSLSWLSHDTRGHAPSDGMPSTPPLIATPVHRVACVAPPARLFSHDALEATRSVMAPR